MPDVQIPNPAGAFGQPIGGVALGSEATIRYFINGAATTLLPGDVVVCNDPLGVSVTTTTTVNDKGAIGVVGPKGAINGLDTVLSTDTYAIGAVVPVIVQGPARVNIAANTVAAKDILTTSGTAKVAVVNAGAPAANAVTGSLIAVAAEASAAKDANNTIRAWIMKA